jgi:hypothetical protein
VAFCVRPPAVVSTGGSSKSSVVRQWLPRAVGPELVLRAPAPLAPSLWSARRQTLKPPTNTQWAMRTNASHT